MGLSEEEVTGLQLHRGSLENGMEREVRLVAGKRPRVQAVCGSGNKHSITRADTHQTEGRKTKNQWLLATFYRILPICQPRRGKTAKAKLVVASTVGKVIECSLSRLWLYD